MKTWGYFLLLIYAVLAVGNEYLHNQAEIKSGICKRREDPPIDIGFQLGGGGGVIA